MNTRSLTVRLVTVTIQFFPLPSSRMMQLIRPTCTLPFGSITLPYLPVRIAERILSRLFICIPLENRSITTNTIHDPTDTVQADTFTHMLHKRGGISMTGNQPANRVLHLNCHFFSLFLFPVFYQIFFVCQALLS